MAGVDLAQVEKLLVEAKAGVAKAQHALADLQPIIDKLDDLVPDVGYGVYLHMVRVTVDQFEQLETS